MISIFESSITPIHSKLFSLAFTNNLRTDQSSISCWCLSGCRGHTSRCSHHHHYHHHDAASPHNVLIIIIIIIIIITIIIIIMLRPHLTMFSSSSFSSSPSSSSSCQGLTSRCSHHHHYHHHHHHHHHVAASPHDVLGRVLALHGLGPVHRHHHRGQPGVVSEVSHGARTQERAHQLSLASRERKIYTFVALLDS